MDDAAQARHGCGQRDSDAVVAAGRHRESLETSAQGVIGLCEGDAVLLGAGGIGALELQVDLTQPDLALDVSRAGERGVADLALGDVLEGLEALLQGTATVGGDLPHREDGVVEERRCGRRPVEQGAAR